MDDEIQILIDDFERKIEFQKIQSSINKNEESLKKNARDIEVLEQKLKNYSDKEKIKASKNNQCPNGDANSTCIVITLDDPTDLAKEKAERLADKLKRGEITGEQYVEQMQNIIDELPFSERERFYMFWELEILKNKLSGLEDFISLIPGGIGLPIKGIEGLITYLQAYTTGGEGAGLKALYPFLGKEAFEFILQEVGIGIAITAAPLFPLGTLGYLLVSGVISEGISDLIYERDKNYRDK